MLSDRCLSLTLVYCGQTIGWIKMKLAMQVGFGPGHTVSDGDPAPLHPKGHRPPQFSTHVCCGQTVVWIKMPLGREVGLGPSHIVLDGDPSPPRKRGITSNFRPMSIVAKRSPISTTAEHFLNTGCLIIRAKQHFVLINHFIRNGLA